MGKYTIHIEPDLSDEHSNIVNEYWEIDNNDFVNKPTQIVEKYGLTLQALKEIISNSSHCTILRYYCSDCEKAVEHTVFSQTAFMERRGVKRWEQKRCDSCKQEYEQQQAEEYRQQRLIEQEQIRQENEVRQDNFQYAIQNKNWNKLSDEELEILQTMFRLKTKRSIYNEVFNGNPCDKSIWAKINNIEKHGLIEIERIGSSVQQFHFPDALEKILFEENNYSEEELDFLSFSLSKNINKTHSRQPNYSGTFILKRAVRLDANVKYIYGGWVNSDGSINLKIQPIDNIVNKNVIQNNIEDEPTHIKNILNSFFNQIDEEDINE